MLRLELWLSPGASCQRMQFRRNCNCAVEGGGVRARGALRARRILYPLAARNRVWHGAVGGVRGIMGGIFDYWSKSPWASLS